MASRGESLLKLVYEHPDDLGARLAYADWLVEQGDVRGEFIALQCARAARGGNIAVERRETELLLEHGRKWLGPFARHIAWFRFERGFLARCELTGMTRTMPGDPSWATLQQVSFRGVDGVEVATFLSSSVMRSLREATGVGNVAFTALQTTGLGAGLRRLHVVGSRPVPIEQVKARGGLPDLEQLTFE